MTPDAFHTGPPAFTSLLPEMPSAAPVSAGVAEMVSHYCGFRADVKSLGPQGSTIEGRYLVSRGDTKLFLKVFDARIVELQQHADRVAAHLERHGVPVVRSMPGEPRAFAPGLCGELFPYVEARFSRCDAAELARTGTVLAGIHRALASFERADEVRAAADEMHRRLTAAAQAILQGAVPYATAVDNLRDAAEGYVNGAVLLQQPPAQMIHGDCNYTNVLVDAGERVYVIDYEESRAAWLNPMFDVAKVIERFVLVPAAPDSEAAATAFLDAYQTGGATLLPVDLRQMLIASNDRALMIMADKASEGLQLPDAEWQKFIGLKQLVARESRMLDRLSSRIVKGRSA